MSDFEDREWWSNSLEPKPLTPETLAAGIALFRQLVEDHGITERVYPDPEYDIPPPCPAERLEDV